MRCLDYTPVYFGPMPDDHYSIAGRGYCTSFVYVLMGEGERVIYVGMSRNPGSRFDRHRSRNWWADVTHLILLRIDGASKWEAARTAKAVETHAIHTFVPDSNIAEVMI